MATTFSRGAQTMNTMFIKPIMRKSYHKKSGPETFKMESEEVKNKSHANENCNSVCWVPHEQSGYFYPKGQEKVMETVRAGDSKVSEVHWISYNEIS